MGRKKRKKSLTANHHTPPPHAPMEKLRMEKQRILMSTQAENKKLKQVKEFNGLLTCILEHDISKTTADYEWTGPKLDPEMWRQVLAFFRWTYDTTKSESQVRLYVNYKTKVWRAWAFPQKEGTGMTALEIDNEEAKEQRKQFSDVEGWFYYGTVHHHCAASAFQSGTDEANERGQDGLHITVGKIDSPQFDIHTRLYQSGYKLVDFDMAEFWDVGDPLAGIPLAVKAMLPADAAKRFIAIQMGTPPPAEQEFPEIWRTNLIRPPRPVVVAGAGHGLLPDHLHYSGRSQAQHYLNRSFQERSKHNIKYDAERAINHVATYTSNPDNRLSIAEALAMVEELDRVLSPEHMDVLDMLLRNDVTPDFFLDCVRELQEKKIKEMTRKQLKEQNKEFKEVGMPTDSEIQKSWDWEGGGNYPGYGGGFGLGG